VAVNPAPPFAGLADWNWWKGPTDRWYLGSAQVGHATGSVTMLITAAGTIYAMPFLCPRGGTVNGLGVKVFTTAGAGTTARVALYQNANNPTGANGLYPTAKVCEVTVPIDGSGNTFGNPNQVLTPGLYWIAVWANASPTLYALTADRVWPVFGAAQLLASPGQEDTQGIGFSYASGLAYGALPANFPGAFADANFNMITDTMPMGAVKFSA
jgi:hypothetical protein